MSLLHLFFHELFHFSVSTLIGLVLGVKLKVNRYVAVFVSLLAGFFVDVDHLVDYGVYLTENHKLFSLRQFLSADYFDVNKRNYVPLHGWEWSLILILSYIIINKRMSPREKRARLFDHRWLVIAGVSLLAHLLIDQFTHGAHSFTYFYFYRLFYGFRINY